MVGVWGLPMAVKFICMLFGSHFFFCLFVFFVDLKLRMYEMGVPRGCLISWMQGRVLGLWEVVGDSVWYVIGEKTIVVCKSALFNILDWVWNFSAFFNSEYACVGAILDLG